MFVGLTETILDTQIKVQQELEEAIETAINGEINRHTLEVLIDTVRNRVCERDFMKHILDQLKREERKFIYQMIDKD